MNFDKILEAWRTQDETPLYGVSPELLRVVVDHDYAKVRHELVWDLWMPPWVIWGLASLFLMLFFAVFNAMTAIGKLTPIVWDYVGAGIAIGAIALSAGAYWVGHARQAARERGFGKSRQEEIRRKLSRIDYQLSQYERLTMSLLMAAPIWTLAILFFWILIRLDGNPFGWSLAIFISSLLLSTAGMNRYFKKRLLEHKRRLNQLLELLDMSEAFSDRLDQA
jgi:hypothetical protein